VHIVDRYMETVKTLSVKNDGAGLDYFIPKEEETKASDIPAGHQMGYIGIVIGATYATKRLPPEKLQELCSAIHYPIILLGGPEDKALGEQLAQANEAGRVYNACGKFTLNESASLVRNARLIISHDTGLMHIAAAFKKPILSVWGNTVPAFGMTPYYGDRFLQHNPRPFDVFEVNGLSCRPCSKLGYAKCPKGHFKCMRQQDVVGMAVRAMEKKAR
jgi:ADP-heptose:LPS heptosyltransferase